MPDLDHLDRIDRNILAALGGNGRLSMAELADAVGLSKTPVQARVRRLEADGVIRGIPPSSIANASAKVI